MDKRKIFSKYIYKKKPVKHKDKTDLKKRLSRYANSFLVTAILLGSVGSEMAYAVEDNIMGVPLQKFDKITNASKKLDSTLESYKDSSELTGYQIKYMQDSYSYMYHILYVAEELSDNVTNVIPTHIIKYNESIKLPLTKDDQIIAEFENNDDGYTVTTKSDIAKTKLSGLAGELGGEEGDETKLTYFSLLSQVREDLGFTQEIIKDSTYEDSSISQSKMNSYLKDNISNIRLLMTATKEFLVENKEFISDDTHKKLSAYFVDTYDKIVRFSYDNEIDTLKDLDLLGERISYTFTRDAPGAEKFVGEWRLKEKVEGEEEEETYVLENYSEYMLKNISASSTFRPFETSLNNIDAFAFLGEQNKTFHETFGTKRKLLLTPTEGYNNLNTAVSLDSVKNLKYMTLREFVKNPDKPKVLYLDNLPYTINEVDKVQNIATGKEEKKEDGEENSEVAGNTEEESDPSWWDKIWTGGTKATLWLRNMNPFMKFIIAEPQLSGQEGLVESLIFASGDMSSVGSVGKELKAKTNDVNEGYLIYKNIMEEYYDLKNDMKMKNDMDKPLYIDIYGNILSASGIVIIPAMSNPFLFKDDKPSYNFNRAYIESYPNFTLKDGILKVDRQDKGKIVLGMKVMNDEEIKAQEEMVDTTFDLPNTKEEDDKKEDGKEDEEKEEDKKKAKTTEDGKEVDEDEISDEATNDLGNDKYGVIPGVNFYVTPVEGTFKPNKYTVTNYLKPVANKFDNEYEPTKALDIWSFAKTKGSSLDSYDEVMGNVKKLKADNRKALIDEYTVKLSFAESDGGEVVSFLDIPDSKEIKRFMYITNLEHVTEIDGTTIKDKKVFDTDVAYAITQEVYINGIYDTNELNSLVPEFIGNIYDKYVEFLLGTSNNRYESVLSTGTDNSILYSKGIEEVEVMKNVLPLVYKLILLLAISAIIIHLILTVVVQESKFKQLMKIITVLYLVTFLLNTSGWMIDNMINKPTARMFAKENAYWTLVEQEKNTHLKEMVTKDEVVEKEPEDGSIIKLYKIPYSYPYKMLTTKASEGNVSMDEFYEHYLTNDGRFRAQNNEMYVEGNYLVSDTKTIFDSSAVVVDDVEDVRLKLKHEVYHSPELAYYLPYYMFIDNIVYNLNSLTEINTRIPNDLAYASGTVKTTGRLSGYINSAMFLDYEEYTKRIEAYEGSDKISEELTVAKIKEVTERYGNPNDFLGIRKILNLVNEDELLPFEATGIEKVQKTGWYPVIEEVLSRQEANELEKKALKVNDKVKSFMLELGEISGDVSDEHLIKTIALYASLEFNREFGSMATNKGPTNIELSDVPIERLLMSLSIPRQGLINNSVTSYSNYIVESVGYWGLLLSSANDMLIIFINYVKPFLMVLIWVMAGLIIFIKKIVIPDPENRSILGSLKIMAFYIGVSLIYAIMLISVIKVINFDGKLVVGQILLLVINLLYVYALLVMLYSLIRDGVNLGNAVMFKGLEGTIKSIGQAVKGTASGLPIFEKYLGNYTDKFEENTRHLGKHLEQKSLKSMDTVGDIGIGKPIDFGASTMRMVSNKIGRKNNNEGEQYNQSYVSGDFNSGYLVNPKNGNPSRQQPNNSNDFASTLLRKEKMEIEKEQRLKGQYVDANTGKNQKDSVKLSYDKKDAQKDYLDNNIKR